MKFIHHRILILTAVFLLTALNLFAQTEREKGLAFYESGDYKAAIGSLEKAVAANKKDGEAWRFLGMAYGRNKESNKAVAAFEKAMNISDMDFDKTDDTPLKIISKRPPKFTMEARQSDVSGKVLLFVEFRADGKIGYIFPYRILPDGLTETSIEAARTIKFEPAIRNGKSVSVVKLIEYSFTLY